VRITRRAEGGMQVVTWSLRPDNTTATWQRWAGSPVTTTTALQEMWLRSQQFQGGEPGQLKALTGLDQWQVYFFQGNGWANCQSTGNVPGADAAGPAVPSRQALPSGVRLVLAFAPGSGLNGSLVRDTLLAP